jgi:hypothetical protein
MNNFRYILQPYKNQQSRSTCPACGRHRSFVKYIDTATGLIVNDIVGRCNHENKCGYHLTPKQFFKENNQARVNYQIRANNPIKPLPPTFIEVAVLKQSLKYQSNNFIEYLLSIFNPEIVSDLIAKYFIGSSRHWPGATVFWQIDPQGNIRSGKIMQYDPKSGKRVKNPFDHITWVHSVLNIPDFSLSQCLFGDHLLTTEPNKPAAIVESEKTALIASIYFPQFTWLATGSKEGLKAEKLNSLKNRKIFAFPDLGAFSDWEKKAQSFKLKITISDFLETHSSDADKKDGLDLADYLVRYNYRNFQQTNSIKSSVVLNPLSQISPYKLLPPHPSDDEIFSQMLKKNPFLLDFVNELGLVNAKTNQSFILN